MSGSLAGRVALVTNASTALGYSIARRLGQAGAKIFLSDPDKTRLVGGFVWFLVTLSYRI
jgi:NAD(P)-dependent dehydrogenase (short-subunit alcohol dehydrogenase family)